MNKLMKYQFKLLTVFILMPGVLFFAGCPDVFNPASTVQKGLKITLSGEAIEARTLYPGMPSFSGFEISFYNPNTQYDNVELGKDQKTVVVEDIPVGDWTITATGFVNINGENRPAARGKGNITIIAFNNPSQNPNNLDIELKAIQQEGENGTLRYNITYPSDKVEYGNISLKLFGSSSSSYSGEFYQSPGTGVISIAPGFYVMTVNLYEKIRPNNYQPVVWSEIVQIYSNLETKAEKIFNNTDLNKFITLGGTINVRVDNNPPEYFYLNAYLNDYNGIPIGSCQVTGNSWSIVLPAFDHNVNIYFKAENVNYQGDSYNMDVPITAAVKDTDNKNIALGNVYITTVTLSGTVTVTYGKDSSKLSDINITVTDNHSSNKTINLPSSRSNNTWSVKLQAFNTPPQPQVVSYRVNGNQYFSDGGNGYWENDILRENDNLYIDPGVTTTVNAANISNINLNIGNIPSIVPTSPPPTPLTNNTWTDGNNTSGNVEWYSIDVTSGTTYYLWWNNRWDGNYTKTQNIQVHAFYDNNDTLIYFADRDNAWNTPASFTANRTGKVNIRVSPGYGTYGIVYNTTGTRPGTGGGFINTAGTALTSGVWIDGEITTSNREDWYIITASPGSYYVWLNSSGCNNLKDLSADITAWSANGTLIFYSSSAWDPSVSFNTNLTEPIYIRVRSYGGYGYEGKYGIAYSTTNTRPNIDPSNGSASLLAPGSASPADSWKNGTITGGNADWYYVNINAGTTYYLWWNDANEGNYFKTLDVTVSVWYNNGSLILNTGSAWYYPQSFTAEYSGRMYIRVNPEGSSGTYSITYSTSSNKPHINPSTGAVTALSNNVWADGNITTSGSRVWYSINTTAGAAYYLWWDDAAQVDTIQTLDIDVEAWYGDGTPVYFENYTYAWSHSASFTAMSTERIYINVYASDGTSPGTYRLVYSTGKIKPGG